MYKYVHHKKPRFRSGHCFGPELQEDETCTFTITGSDVDPDDTLSIEVLSIFYASPRELTHNAIPVVQGQVFTIPTSGLVFTYKNLPDICPSSSLVMQVSATETPPASSGIAPTYHSLAEVFVLMPRSMMRQ